MNRPRLPLNGTTQLSTVADLSLQEEEPHEHEPVKEIDPMPLVLAVSGFEVQGLVFLW